MKKKSLLFYALISLCITAASAGENILSTFGESRDEKNLEQCLKNGLEKLGVNTSEKIPEENLIIINFILKHTYENIGGIDSAVCPRRLGAGASDLGLWRRGTQHRP